MTCVPEEVRLACRVWLESLWIDKGPEILQKDSKDSDGQVELSLGTCFFVSFAVSKL